MSEVSTIVCKPTKWIKIRVCLMLLMFGVFAFLFYKDGTIGYKEQNAHFVFHSLFNDTAPKAAQKFNSDAEWRAYVSKQKLQLPDVSACPLPEDFDRTQGWPSELAGGLSELKGSKKTENGVWLAYAGERGWDAKPVEHMHDQADLNTQMYMTYGSLALVVVVLALFLRTLTRTMEVTELSFIAPGGKVVPFSSMRRIDTRKWDTKGVAVIEYDDGAGSMKKVKVDGMIYGQFKKEDGEPAERLFAHIMEHFSGDVIEFEDDDGDDDDSQPTENTPQSKISGSEANS